MCTKLEIILVALYPNATRILQPADVSAFKPLKTGWKKGLTEWRKENPDKQINKETFAPILKYVLDKAINTQIVKNGFKACGLYPWNPENVDYSKCLGKNTARPETAVTSSVGNVGALLSFEKFSEIVGLQKIRSFENMQESNANCNEDYCKLFDIWKFFKSSEKYINEHQLSNSHNLEEIFDINDMEIIFAENNVTQYLISDNDTNTNLKTQELIVSEGDGKATLPLEANYNQIVLEAKVSEKVSPEDVNPDLDNEKELIVNQTQEHITLLSENHDSGSSFKLDPYSLSTTIYFNTDDCKEPEYEFVNEKSMDETYKTNSSLIDFVVYPQTPERKGKRKQSEKLPFVLTSSGWKRIEREKIEIKKEQEKKKVERKQMRVRNMEARKLKEQLQKTSKNTIGKKVEKFKGCVKVLKKQLSGTCTKTRDTENIEPKINIISDIKIPTQNNPHVRNLFGAESDEKTQYENQINLTVNKTINNPFQNPTIYKGLCYICTNNISVISIGVKCQLCMRTYHLTCIFKYSVFVDQVFLCNACKK